MQNIKEIESYVLYKNYKHVMELIWVCFLL